MRAHQSILTTAAVVGLAFFALLSTGTHTVRGGETLATIAADHDTTVAALIRANGLADPDLIFVGQELDIPDGGPTGSASTYTVRPGDTLSGIASRQGTSVADLMTLNGLRRPNLIRIGQVLRLPEAGTAPDGGATTHLVRAGDTVSRIANRYGISQAQLVAANGITDGIVYIDQRLHLLPVGQGGTGGGEIVCPVHEGASFVNDWGLPRSGGRSHAGNDLFAPRGRPAVATVGGTALQAVGRRGGRQVQLIGDDGVSYYYTHLDRFGTAGRVNAGAVIGYVGNTGNAAGTPTHVHFELHPGGGAAVNPYPALVAAC